MGTLGIVGIVAVVIGIVLIILAFTKFRRTSENEVSRDFFVSPLFIIGALVIVAGVITGILGSRQ